MNGTWRSVFSSSADQIRDPETSPAGKQAFLVSWVSGAAESLFATLFPADCRLCGSPLINISRLPVCEDCLSAMRPIAGGICSICGERLVSPYVFTGEGDEPRCGLCRRMAPPFAKAVAYGSYDGGLAGTDSSFEVRAGASRSRGVGADVARGDRKPERLAARCGRSSGAATPEEITAARIQPSGTDCAGRFETRISGRRRSCSNASNGSAKQNPRSDSPAISAGKICGAHLQWQSQSRFPAAKFFWWMTYTPPAPRFPNARGSYAAPAHLKYGWPQWRAP